MLKPAAGLTLSAALLLGACASTSLGVASPGEAQHVASVEVMQHDAKAPAAFAESLRVAVLREAALYGAVGRPLVLKIQLDRVHLKNPVLALTIGDDNQAKGRVVVLDAATGREAGSFPVQVNADRTGVGVDVASFVALSVVGALDPTGAIDIGAAAAEAGSAQLDARGAQAGMSANFARETLRLTFGDAKAKAAHAPGPGVR
jgi:hypothetical protein